MRNMARIIANIANISIYRYIAINQLSHESAKMKVSIRKAANEISYRLAIDGTVQLNGGSSRNV